jgi:Cu2+-exporting ATPase
LTFHERDALYDDLDGRQKVFCCHGCRGIYRLIHTSGLDEFYERRTGWKPGPPEDREITAEPFLESVRVAGEEAEIAVNLDGIRCASCIWLIERFFALCDGISRVSVNYALHRARIRWSPERISLDTILKRMVSLGYTPHPVSASALEERLEGEKKDLLIRFGTASFFSMQLMLFTTALYAGYFQGIDPLYKRMFELLAWALATPVMFYCGYPFLSNAWRAAKNGAFTMDTLIVIGSFSAYAYSVAVIFLGGEVYFDTAAMIITFILLGRFMESGAKARATGAISSLISLLPKEARLIRGSGDKENASATVPISALRKGDIIEVIPGDKIPVDCVVIDGTSETNESMLTGESMPVSKSKRSDVFAGTMNLNGRLVLEVKRIGDDTALSQIIRAVGDAQERKAPIQNVADRIVAWFVPAIVLIAVAAFLFWLFRDGTVQSSLLNAISVLVISCPCALGLATPLAILISSTVLSSRGILMKGGDVIEAVARTDFVSFDKTGTLTTGEPSLTNILNYGIDKRELQLLAASLERHSEHSLGKALSRGFPVDELFSIDSFQAWPGQGVEGTLNGKGLLAGSVSFLRSRKVIIDGFQAEQHAALSSEGNTVIGFAIEDDLKGWLAVSDALRGDATETVQSLQHLGLTVHLLTGDNRGAAEAVGRRAGISLIDAEVLPVQKARRIAEIKEAGNRVLMIGDGINDAPALVEADAGVALGNATNIAMESADVVLMRNDLGLLPEMIKVSRKTLSVIKLNLFWAFSYNLIAIPLAVSGKIHPIMSAAFMAISSLIVVGNSLRLRTAGKPEGRL